MEIVGQELPSLEERVAQAKQFDYTKHLDYDMYVDAKDGLNNWCVGEIVDVNKQEQTVKVHFEGWGQRYDEVFKFNSLRINFFRKYSEGYTGQKKNALRKFSINFTT